MTRVHSHPNPFIDRLIQYGAAGVGVLMLLSVPLQLVLASVGGLFALTAVVTLLLTLPVLMLTTATPAVTLSAEGLTIQPRVWRAQTVRWSDIHAVKDYPLLPPPGSESGRKAFVGRSKYRPAEGKMLVIPCLPAYYRVTGFFAGEGLTPVIALTNRTHTDYEALIAAVLRSVDSQPD